MIDKQHANCSQYFVLEKYPQLLLNPPYQRRVHLAGHHTSHTGHSISLISLAASWLKGKKKLKIHNVNVDMTKE